MRFVAVDLVGKAVCLAFPARSTATVHANADIISTLTAIQHELNKQSGQPKEVAVEHKCLFFV